MRPHPALAALAAACALAVLSTPAAARPATSHADCGPLTSGRHAWIGFVLHGVDCRTGHALARSWAGSCERPAAGTTGHCLVSSFTCASRRSARGTLHFGVDCAREHQHVRFTYFPGGLTS